MHRRLFGASRVSVLFLHILSYIVLFEFFFCSFISFLRQTFLSLFFLTNFLMFCVCCGCCCCKISMLKNVHFLFRCVSVWGFSCFLWNMSHISALFFSSFCSFVRPMLVNQPKTYKTNKQASAYDGMFESIVIFDCLFFFWNGIMMITMA